MSYSDKTDEELVRLVLRELPPEDLYTIRERAQYAPASRGTLVRWDSGDYAMWKKTRRKVLVWLNELTGDPISGPGDAGDLSRILGDEEALEGARRKARALKEARRDQSAGGG